MSVPDNDTLCRFIRPGKKTWNKSGRPKSAAFKPESDGTLSTFHRDRVVALGDQLADLCLDSLRGSGQAHYTAGDFVRLANGLVDIGGGEDTFEVQVEWRETVSPGWERWSGAHAQIETNWSNLKFPKEYRDRLMLHYRHLVAPSDSTT